MTDMMSEHISDGSIDLAIADVPYFIRGSPEVTATDLYIHRNGMKPLFNEEWDRFDGIEDYETFCTAWIDETMRCLNDEGSLFVFRIISQHWADQSSLPDEGVCDHQ